MISPIGLLTQGRITFKLHNRRLSFQYLHELTYTQIGWYTAYQVNVIWHNIYFQNLHFLPVADNFHLILNCISHNITKYPKSIFWRPNYVINTVVKTMR
jgi:hypothetical protein